MHYHTILPAAALAASASAKMIRVDVGKDGLRFTPEVIKADKGDMLDFHFYPKKHSVALGQKDKACMPASNSDMMFYSGFMPTDNGEADKTFQVMVNSTDAMYIYCTEDQHCQHGMAGVINGDKDALSKYKDDAAMAKENVAPDSVTGGMIMSAGGDSSMSMSMTTGSGMSMTSGTDMSMSTGGSMMSSGGSMMTTGTDMMSSSGGAGAGGGMMSSTSGGMMPTGTDGAAASSSTGDNQGAAAGFRASIAGVVAAAGGVAALML